MDGLATRGGALMHGRLRAVASAVLFGCAGLIHLPPLIGLSGASGLQRLYGIVVEDPNLQIMLQHRALLLGVVGAWLLCAAWRVQWRHAAAAAGLLSMGSYVVIALVTGDYNLPLQRVVNADLIAITCVLLGWGLGRTTSSAGINRTQ